MINTQEASYLVPLLDEDSRPFDEIFADFSSRFPPEHHFRICCALAMLLKDKLLKPTQRLVAFVILHHTYSSSNPFINVLIDAACDDTSEEREKAFIQLLLGSISANDDKEVLKQSAVHYIEGFDSSSHVLLQPVQLREQYCDRVKAEPSIFESICKTAAVKNVIADPDVPIGRDANSLGRGSGDTDAAVADLLKKLSLEEGLSPQWIRPFPPILPVQSEELVWLDPNEYKLRLVPFRDPMANALKDPLERTKQELVRLHLYPKDHHKLLWDNDMCPGTSCWAPFRDLMAKALKCPLERTEQEVSTTRILQFWIPRVQGSKQSLLFAILQQFLEVAANSKLVYKCGFTPKKLPELVEHNPDLAVGLLKLLMNRPVIEEFFTVLVNMDTSHPSIKVVEMLATAVDLPMEFLSKYIKKCTSSCQRTTGQKKKAKITKMVCLFLHSLIQTQTKIINDQGLCRELETFSRIKSPEADNLKRLLNYTWK